MADMASQETVERHILPTNVRPTHYDLQLEVDLDTTVILGSVAINLDVIESSSAVSLNAVDVEILTVRLCSEGHEQTPIQSRHDGECVTFEFGRALHKASNATLSIEFQADMNEKGFGFYRTSYEDESGAKKYMASTQLAPVDARRVFPCFDEPALKASFSVTLIVDKDLKCLSNMNVEAEELRNGNRKVVKFAKSPPMSTYLVAMAVGDFEYIETTSFRIPIRVYTTPGLSSGGRFALDLAARTLDFYEQIFDSPFPLPKMDMIAVHDMLGAMENWGLVTFAKSALLLDENNSGIRDRKSVASIVQHELAHQWFGNLVTMDFWDGLWLNEGFATWMSWYSNNVFYPEWNTWQDFVTGDLQKALGLDCLRSSHPVEVPVHDTNDINQIFDAISYSKGSCVIRMLTTYLGEEVFLRGIQGYLKKYAYGNTKTDDLWDALSYVSGKDVGKEMSIWTRRVGYPLLTITESETEGKIYIRQDRFLQGGTVTERENEVIYPVSLGLLPARGNVEDILLDTRKMEISLDDMGFFKLNSNHSGFYRTLYTPERLIKLGSAMQDGRLSVEDRMGIIADASALASSGYQKTSTLLAMLAKLKDEKNPFVWKQITTCLASIKDAFKFEDNDLLEGLKHFERDLVAPQAKALGWDFSQEGDPSMTKFKSEMFESAGEAGDPTITSAAGQMFSLFAAGDRSAINPNLRPAVYAIALGHGSKPAFESLLAFSRETKAPDEFEAAFRGLGNTRDRECIAKLLDLLLSEEVKGQDFHLPFIALRKDAIGAEAIWKWLQAHWTDIENKLSSSLGILGSILGVMLRGLSSRRHLMEVEAFFESKDTRQFGKQLRLVLEGVGANVEWVERDGRDVRGWLRGGGYLV